MNAKKSMLQGLVVVVFLGVAGHGWAAEKDALAGDIRWEKASRRGLLAGIGERGVGLLAGRWVADGRRFRGDDMDSDRTYREERRSYPNGYDRHETDLRHEQQPVDGPKEIGLTGPLLLNIFLPFAIGSWVSGDYLGGTITLALQVLGGGLGVLFLGGLGALLSLAGWITGIVMVIVHVNNVNSRAKRAYRMRPSYRAPARPYEDHGDRSFQSNASVMKFAF